MKLEHVALNVPDPVKAARWYAEHLGMRIVLAREEPPHIHFLADQAGQAMIELYCMAEAGVPDYSTIDPFVLHIAFAVDDIERARGQLTVAGATAVGEVRDLGTGKLLFMRDPWGVPIQLVQRERPLI